jgi:hypothetical protein
MPEVLSFRSPAAARKPRRLILSATTLRALTLPSKGSVDCFDDFTPGLSLRVAANDVRTWTLFYRDKNGRQKRLTLGRFSSVSLADARELAREALLKVAKGGDPVLEKRAARNVLTFGELADRYLEEHAKPNKRSWEEDQRQLDSSLLPKWRNQPAGEITSDDLLTLLNAKLRQRAHWRLDIVHERLQLNALGRPYHPVNPDAQDALPEVRKLLAERKYSEAAELGLPIHAFWEYGTAPRRNSTTSTKPRGSPQGERIGGRVTYRVRAHARAP